MTDIWWLVANLLYLIGLIQGIRHADPDLPVLLHMTIAIG
jgi:hypothetical protein